MGNRQTKFSKKQKVYKSFNELACKDAPILKISRNTMYQARISDACSKPFMLDEEVSRFLDNCSTSCSTQDSSVTQKIQEESDFSKLLFEKPILTLKVKSQEKDQKQVDTQMHQEAEKYDQSLKEITAPNNISQSDSQITKKPHVENQPKKKVTQIKQAISKQKRDVYEATTFLMRCGALKRF